MPNAIPFDINDLADWNQLFQPPAPNSLGIINTSNAAQRGKECALFNREVKHKYPNYSEYLLHCIDITPVYRHDPRTKSLFLRAYTSYISH